MLIECFSTDRYMVRHWRPLVDDPAARKVLVASLAEILTPPVLKHLPPSLQLAPGDDAISTWIAARDAESAVMAVTRTSDNRMIGLVILSEETEKGAGSVVHVGYLLSEIAWGQGAASELLFGLVSALRRCAPLRLVGGVDRDNPASARVLVKVGFVRDMSLSTPQSDIYTRDIV